MEAADKHDVALWWQQDDLWKSEMWSHLDPPANGQAVIYLTGLLEVFISELSILATVSDNSVRYQAINLDHHYLHI